MRRWLLLALLVAACTTPAPPHSARPESFGTTKTHIVRRGETLWSISQRYGSNVDAVALANRISDPTQIRVGQRLVVPAGRPHARLHNGKSWTQSHPRGRKGTVKLAWPLRGRVTSSFGMRNGAHHDGLDISVPKGTRIYAAESGRVIHSGDRLSGYGNLIVIKHIFHDLHRC